MDDFDYDYCYECRGYGDDYYINYYGEEVCACDDCPHNESNRNGYKGGVIVGNFYK